MSALLLLLSCSTAPVSSWTPLPPPLPQSPGGYGELVLVLESLDGSGDPTLMKEQVREGVVPQDVVLEHRDLSALLETGGLQVPIFGLEDEQPNFFALLALADAAILESRVHLAYGEGEYAWGALAPVLEIAGYLQAAGGGLMPFMVGTAVERSVLRELETVLATPYGLGRAGEQELHGFLLARQARPALAAYAMSTECETAAGTLLNAEALELNALFYDADETVALYYDYCGAGLAMSAKPYVEWEEVVPELPSRWLVNRAGIEVLSLLAMDPLRTGRAEVELQMERGLLRTAVELRAGHKGQWPVARMPTDPSTGKALLWDGSTLMGGAGIEEMEVSLKPAIPVWSDGH